MGKVKGKGSPQIPLSLRNTIEANRSDFIDERYINSGNKHNISRKILRKRKRSEKKQRRQLFYTKGSLEKINNDKSNKIKDKPPKKKQKIKDNSRKKIIKQKNIETSPIISREDADIEFYERKLKKYYHKPDQLDDLLDGITAGTDEIFNPKNIINDDNDNEYNEFNENNELSSSSDENIKNENIKEKEDNTNNIKSISQKYIPPSMRKQLNNASETDLQKKIRGLLNKISESNLSIMANEFQLFYETNSRHDVNKYLSYNILDDCNADAAQTTLIPVYAGIIALLHFSIGIDVGGSFLNIWYKKQEEYYCNEQKEAFINCLKLLSYLYNYNMIHCSLLFDIIREYIKEFSEYHIESLLCILKITGLDLRSDDPTALKDIIISLQERVKILEDENKKDIGEEFGIRIKFMLDMIYELKNNKKKHFQSLKAPNNLISLIKKVRKESLSDQLQISLKELSISTDSKWWIRGTSILPTLPSSLSSNLSLNNTNQENKILKLAKKQGMNTDIRRAIFTSIMNADDYIDAFENLLKIPLKGKQDREIINVLIHCCSKEKKYNPFYGYLAIKLCSFHYNHKFTFQYNMWDRFKRLNEENISVIINLASLLAQMIGNNILTLNIFKVVEFYKLKALDVLFYKTVFIRLFCDNTNDNIIKIFERFSLTPELYHLREELKVFFKNAFRKSSLKNRNIYTKEEEDKIKQSLKDITLIFRQAPTDLI